MLCIAKALEGDWWAFPNWFSLLAQSMKEIEPGRGPAFSEEPRSHQTEIDSVRKMENYIGCKAWRLVGNDAMTRDDLSQEARVAIIEVIRRQDYADGYLIKVVSHAMSGCLRRGSSIDRSWPHWRRSRAYRLVRLDQPDGPTPQALRDGHKPQASFEEAADNSVMLDQLVDHLNQREQTVLACLRRGCSQVEAGRILGCSPPTVHRTVGGYQGQGQGDLADPRDTS